MAIKLSVLIPSTEDRQMMTAYLGNHLNKQINANCQNVEILFDWHPTNCVGKKRNDLLDRAIGEYIVFIDSDDFVSDNYINLILNAIEGKPDCVGINGVITTNGRNEQQWFISKEYGKWFVRGNVYYRTPNHISPVRRELALQARFPEVKFAEDFEYSKRLLPLLKTEVIIEEPIYHYAYKTKK